MERRMKTERSLVLILLLCLTSSTLVSQPLASGRSKFLGAGSSHAIWSRFDLYWNQITPGNAGKWGSVEGTQGQYNWSPLDAVYNYAVEKNIPFKEHTLIWGEQQPSWLSSLDSAAQRSAIERWIDTVGKRYPLMAYCDVVNEPLHAPPSYKNALGGDGTTGWDWVITSFQLARQLLAPQVKLLLNEYNILHSTTETNKYLAIINLLKERQLIDGIGIQGHYFEFRSDIGSSPQYVYNISTIKSNLDKLVATGVPVYITEFDIDEPIDSNQVNQYKIYFPIFWQNPGVKGITFWGYHYNDVWSAHPNTYLIDSRGKDRPAMTWLKAYVALPFIPQLHSPLNNATQVPRNPLLCWYSSEAATSYRLQLSRQSYFPTVSILLDTTVTDTLVQIGVLDENTQYYWRVSARNDKGESDFSSPLGFRTGSEIVSVEERATHPQTIVLFQNYPNPFNPVTNIRFILPVRSYVTLKIFNALGIEVATLRKGFYSPGTYDVVFDGSKFPSGVYFYQLCAGNYRETKKLLLVK